jgi:biotin carboxyl carrier protein
MGKKFKINVEGKEYRVEVEEMGVGEEKERDKEISAGKTQMKEKEPYGKYETITEKEKCILAPMPAKVVKVNCKAGERVRRGDVLIILEAMKMENEILSPTDGVVKEVCVVEGTTVSHEDTMILFE